MTSDGSISKNNYLLKNKSTLDLKAPDAKDYNESLGQKKMPYNIIK